MRQYRIFTDATSDLTDVPMAGLPTVEIIPMEIEIDGRTYQYGPMGNITVSECYDLQKSGADIKTTGICPWKYTARFEPVLQKGLDILYLCFSSRLSGTIMSALLSAEELQEKLIIVGHGDCPDGAEVLKAAVATRFPEAEIYVMDIGPVIGAHTGPGMLAILFWGNTR